MTEPVLTSTLPGRSPRTNHFVRYRSSLALTDVRTGSCFIQQRIYVVWEFISYGLLFSSQLVRIAFLLFRGDDAAGFVDAFRGDVASHRGKRVDVGVVSDHGSWI